MTVCWRTVVTVILFSLSGPSLAWTVGRLSSSSGRAAMWSTLVRVAQAEDHVGQHADETQHEDHQTHQGPDQQIAAGEILLVHLNDLPRPRRPP